MKIVLQFLVFLFILWIADKSGLSSQLNALAHKKLKDLTIGDVLKIIAGFLLTFLFLWILNLIK